MGIYESCDVEEVYGIHLYKANVLLRYFEVQFQ
jgi:hypothetical protein